jgi:hypothetical protein
MTTCPLDVATVSIGSSFRNLAGSIPDGKK